ncbi:D-2-hydroxyacid dehydrogenase [Adhaeribacter aquaticus]|uniref:D-2-hydroxyacid dehydrogenase n=1 Tax=Adhaeribacter aquaticus TaxID=299567 RepID=UPI0004064B43|nr:D-2-hydroxyacid dehydrogenase [Adhaeribacter aquaticus]
MNIVFLDTKTMGEVPNLHLLEQFGKVTYYKTTTPEQTANRIKEANILISNKVVLNREHIQEAPDLKLICVAATGTNNIDKAAAEERGIPVLNAVDYSTASVAQVTFALLLQLLNNISYFNNYVKQGEYSQSDIFTHLGRNFWEINGKRFGVIGLGNIGRQVASIAAAFGAEVVYFSASGQNNQQPYLRLELEEFLRTSDIVSIHAPLNQFTANLITYERLKLMKNTALLLNAGRGGIIIEADLARAIDEGLIGGAAIDVFEKEPIRANNPLLQVKDQEKLILTPHIAWASMESRTLLMEKIAANISQFLNQ